MHLDRKDFLVEIGTEELPPKSLQRLTLHLRDQVELAFKKADLFFEGIEVFATPRRMALILKNTAKQQTDRVLEKIGPAITLAYDEQGNPTQAALGFAKSCQVTFAQLTTTQTPKGECLSFKRSVVGESIQTLAPLFIEQALNSLPIPKPMHWGNHPIPFIRPVHWIVMMHGPDVIPCSLFGLPAGRSTRGHRFHHPQMLDLTLPQQYAKTLQDGFVIASYDLRHETIRQQLMALAKTKGQLILDEDLLDEVTGLVEWPVALMGSFEPRFLDVPKEALILAMKVHQKSFPLVDKDNELLPYFLTVANIESKMPDVVIKGNERVMRARLADAQFFFHTDLKNGIDHYVDNLKAVVFQNKLGTLYDKATRLSTLASYIAEKLSADTAQAARAGLLCKADLTTEMVGEFPELQGIMGYYYALHNNELIDVAIAIKEHYLPKHAGDSLPTTPLGNACALADRLDTLVGIFSIHQAPSGEKDPFALRRAALGLLRILIENHLPLDLQELFIQAAKGYPELEKGQVIQETLNFSFERLRSWYLDKGISANTYAAVMARKPTSPYDFDQRITAIHLFQNLPQAQALAAANKRVSNIFKQTQLPAHTHFNYALLELEAEKELADMIEEKSKYVEVLCKKYHYQAALTLLSTLQSPIDRFFDEVMVMVENETIRNNRLILLNNLRELFLQIADISLL